MRLTDNYLELLKRALNNYLYLGGNALFGEYEIVFWSGKDGWTIPEEARPHALTATVKFNAIQALMYDVIRNDVPGDFIEAGIYKGGMLMFMRAFLKANDITDRVVWGADSFEGIPVSKRFKDIGDPVDKWRIRWDAGYDEVVGNFRRYDLLDDQVRFLRGYFAETLPSAPFERIALARLDGDAYESTIDALEGIYPRMSNGGYIIIDDWHLEFCRKAVVDYREANGITDPIHLVSSAVDKRVIHESFWKVGSGVYGEAADDLTLEGALSAETVIDDLDEPAWKWT